MDICKLKQAILGYNKRALAQAITMIEKADPGIEELISYFRSQKLQSRIIGVTGPPGTGKSSLIDHLGLAYTQKGYQVAILAIDPSSPFSGGSFLGDRIRMNKSANAGVFIRSMASRDCRGGLAPSIKDVLELIGAAGYNLTFLETVGAGQSDIAIREVAQTVLVVTVPGLGDGIQALKAGVMEIGDIFAVNKSDLNNVDTAVEALKELTTLKHSENSWNRSIIKVSAAKSEGLDQLIEALDQHYLFLKDSGLLENHKLSLIQNRLEDMVNREIINYLKKMTGNPLKVNAERVLEGHINMLTAVKNLINQLQLDLKKK